MGHNSDKSWLDAYLIDYLAFIKSLIYIHTYIHTHITPEYRTGNNIKLLLNYICVTIKNFSSIGLLVVKLQPINFNANY